MDKSNEFTEVDAILKLIDRHRLLDERCEHMKNMTRGEYIQDIGIIYGHKAKIVVDIDFENSDG